MNHRNHLYQPNSRSMRRFLASMIAELGLAFHPDNYAEEYIKFDNKGEEVKIYTEEECKIINENLKTAHGFYCEAIYDQSIVIWNALKVINH